MPLICKAVFKAGVGFIDEYKKWCCCAVICCQNKGKYTVVTKILPFKKIQTYL